MKPLRIGIVSVITLAVIAFGVVVVAPTRSVAAWGWMISVLALLAVIFGIGAWRWALGRSL